MPIFLQHYIKCDLCERLETGLAETQNIFVAVKRMEGWDIILGQALSKAICPNCNKKNEANDKV